MTFEEDQLDLKEFCADFEKFLLTDRQFTDQSLVVSLNAPFGSGKSTFLEMWRDELTERREAAGKLAHPSILHSWHTDFLEDPFIPIIEALLAHLDPKKTKKLQGDIREAANDVGWFLMGLGNSALAHWLGFMDLDDRLAETFSPKNFQGDCDPPLPLKAGIKYGEEIEF